MSAADTPSSTAAARMCTRPERGAIQACGHRGAVQRGQLSDDERDGSNRMQCPRRTISFRRMVPSGHVNVDRPRLRTVLPCDESYRAPIGGRIPRSSQPAIAPHTVAVADSSASPPRPVEGSPSGALHLDASIVETSPQRFARVHGSGQSFRRTSKFAGALFS
jgi:hypothetical protein